MYFKKNIYIFSSAEQQYNITSDISLFFVSVSYVRNFASEIKQIKLTWNTYSLWRQRAVNQRIKWHKTEPLWGTTNTLGTNSKGKKENNFKMNF